jgi:hypothetical protein
MNPLTVSAQFAAYVWYTEARQGTHPHEEASRFAEQNWASFLPSAQEGWGKLLMRLVKPSRVERGRLRRHRSEVEGRAVEGMATVG